MGKKIKKITLITSLLLLSNLALPLNSFATNSDDYDYNSLEHRTESEYRKKLLTERGVMPAVVNYGISNITDTPFDIVDSNQPLRGYQGDYTYKIRPIINHPSGFDLSKGRNERFAYLLENGTEYFSGNKTMKQITVTNIDKVPPTLEFQYPSGYTLEDIEVTVKGSDNLSGVKKITLQNGNTVNSATHKFIVSANGQYTFKVEDNAGNVTTKVLQINNIDRTKTKPTLNYTINPNTWTNSNVTISLTASAVSGVNYIVLPNNQKVYASSTNYTVTTNGVYSFFMVDKSGNVGQAEVKVDKIEKNKPSVTITKNPNKVWANVNTRIDISATDN